MQGVLLEIKNLRVVFTKGKENVEPLRGVNLEVNEGEILGLVGGSGSGKTLTALSITGLLPKEARVSSGEILFAGDDLIRMSERELRDVRGGNISYVFQDPAASLNPVLTIKDQLIETIRLHRRASKKESFATALDVLKEAGIPSPQDIMLAYPHQLSGGMKQRVMIAMAVSCRPRLLIADEPTTALDVTIQAQILDLLSRLREELGISIILITHDLSTVLQVADRTAVMRAGEIVECGDTASIYESPRHSYTKMLIACIPKINAG